ncbi:MAG: signal peptidase II [Paracoccaceae bacterium]|nr:signal peptidase II [Paracoccaceae bacterium]
MWFLYAATIVALVLDQASKVIILKLLRLPELGQIDVFPPLLNFRMAWNYGINFGLFSQDSLITRWILIAVAMAIIGFVFVWIRREQPKNNVMLAAGLLIGGALGNVLDRVLYGAVVDFLNISCCGIVNPFAFNIADVEIFIGAIGVALLNEDKNVA